MKRSVLTAAAVLMVLAPSAYAQEQGSNADTPEGAHVSGGEVPAPRDVAYPGTITLKVDLTDVERRVLNVHETIPVKPGALTLLYPEWLPGNHAPRGPIESLAGLTIMSGSHAVEWVRDPVNVYAFHVTVPAGATHLDLEFQFASAFLKEQGRTVVTTDLLGLQWNSVVLYPAGYYVSRIPVAPSVALPDGWEYAAALELDSRHSQLLRFKTVSLETLVDSPVFAGRYFRALDLDPGAQTPVHLNVFADGPEALDVKPLQLAAHRKLVQEAYALLGPPHYERYEFLLALSDFFGDIGLEHHRSSENRRAPNYFTEWDRASAGRDLLSHEFSHSWNGKFRRPADLATADFNVPMQNSLLWVYEGLTNYFGAVLAARSGLWSEDFARQAWAALAASMDRNRAGRTWRSLRDTTEQPIITARRPLSWLSWQRTEDYYTEGELLWLDVDTRLRELSGGKRSLDDFAHAFYAGAPNPGPVTYTFADVVQALQAVAPFDWGKFFTDHLNGHGPGAPLDGLTRGGWKLVFAENPSEYSRSLEEQHKVVDFTYSLGFAVSSVSGQLTEVRWGGPAYDAGLALGTGLIAVNGREYRPERLRTAVAVAKFSKQPIELLVKNLDRYRIVRIPYFEGLKYPQLQRIEKTEDRLAAILRPHAETK